MIKTMYLLTNIPYGKKEPCAYCITNGYYVYQVKRDDCKVYGERLFDKAEDALEVLLKLRKESKCRSIH